MKKCPYCAEEIQDQAIVCRYCNRDLEIQNLNTGIKSRNLTLDDLDLLFKKWGESYGHFPRELKINATETVPEISRDFLTFVVGEYLRYKLFNDNEVQGLIKRSTLLLYQWGFLCIAIGVESAFNNINDRDVPLYLFACSKPVNHNFVYFLNPLLDKRLISENKAYEVNSLLKSNMSDAAVNFANQGFIYHNLFEPKFTIGEKSPLSVELLKIDIS